MKMREWLSLPKLKNEDDFSSKLNRNDKFLYGDRMIQQLEEKKKGQEITYLQVLKVEGKNVEYMPRFEILEEDF